MSKLQVIDIVGIDAKVEGGALISFPKAQDHWIYRVWNAPFSDQSMTIVFDSVADKVVSVEFKPWRDDFE